MVSYDKSQRNLKCLKRERRNREVLFSDYLNWTMVDMRIKLGWAVRNGKLMSKQWEGKEGMET